MVSIVVSSRFTPSRATPWTESVDGNPSDSSRDDRRRDRARWGRRARRRRARRRLTIDKPLGLTLEAGRVVGAFVANVADGSNAARTDGVARGDVVRG